DKGKLRSRPQNIQFYCKEGLTWTSLTISSLSMRYVPNGYIFDAKGPMCFPINAADIWDILGYTNSKIINIFLKHLAPTMDYSQGPVGNVPFKSPTRNITNIIKELVTIHKNDWDTNEISFEFQTNILVKLANDYKKISDGYTFRENENKKIIYRVKELEEYNNSSFIDLFELNDILSPEVNLSDITLDRAAQENDIIKMISYSIGCMMGRYSLDREGLVYAHEGNKGFAELVAEGAYKTFPADNDGILPLMDEEWFDDDVTSRVKEFVRTVWGEEHLQENLEFIAESLCLYAISPKKGEPALDTIRRYLSTQFWKEHMKMYKKRPIYWLFSSGKTKAFECLVYLHRYNDATLARMRTEYVVPLLARYQANIDRLNELVDGASGGEATRLKRERDSLSKKFNELRSFDDRLRHYADMRISIDLDDGVKVNYGKFGDLLADVKAITGNAPEVI
ncbi:BREX-1 system adenine-specific DNA-methyltransferase PglX, partial [Salmonella enterica]|nr:BREX-1 system adenine-specific DNA-methyltransferase PglX [Salmonella enterica]